MASLATGVQTIPGSTGFTKSGLYQFPVPICNRLQYKRATNFHVKCQGKDGAAGTKKGDTSDHHKQDLPKSNPADKQDHKGAHGFSKAQTAMIPGWPGIARTNELLAMIALMKMIGAHQANTHLVTSETAEHWNGRLAMFGIGYQ